MKSSQKTKDFIQNQTKYRKAQVTIADAAQHQLQMSMRSHTTNAKSTKKLLTAPVFSSCQFIDITRCIQTQVILSRSIVCLEIKRFFFLALRRPNDLLSQSNKTNETRTKKKKKINKSRQINNEKVRVGGQIKSIDKVVRVRNKRAVDETDDCR